MCARWFAFLSTIRNAWRETEWNFSFSTKYRVVARIGRNVLTEFLEYDRGNRFVGEYMTKVDGATMFHSLEARSPFLDQTSGNLLRSLSYELRLSGGRLKSVLRELARANWANV